MGWASGSELAEDVWNVVKPFIPNDERQSPARAIISLFRDFDCDTLDEATTLIRDARLPVED